VRYVLNGALKYLLDLSSADSPANTRPVAVVLLPELCIPGFMPAHPDVPVPTKSATGARNDAVRGGLHEWPATAVEQLAAVKAAAKRVGADCEAILAGFATADDSLVRRHLETLVVMGEV
jgi:hypothetical protein